MKIHNTETNREKIITKIRGFSLVLSDVNRRINFSSMKSLLMNNLINNREGSIETTDEYKIKRNKLKRQLVTVTQTKKYFFKYIKQYINKSDLTVVPYGY